MGILACGELINDRIVYSGGCGLVRGMYCVLKEVRKAQDDTLVLTSNNGRSQQLFFFTFTICHYFIIQRAVHDELEKMGVGC